MTDKTYYAVVEFEDGLQVVPNNWLSIDLQSAVWPNFTNNKMYDKAVKLMKDPEPTWTRHLIKKIYGTYCKQCYIILLCVLLFWCMHLLMLSMYVFK